MDHDGWLCKGSSPSNVPNLGPTKPFSFWAFFGCFFFLRWRTMMIDQQICWWYIYILHTYHEIESDWDSPPCLMYVLKIDIPNISKHLPIFLFHRFPSIPANIWHIHKYSIPFTNSPGVSHNKLRFPKIGVALFIILISWDFPWNQPYILGYLHDYGTPINDPLTLY